MKPLLFLLLLVCLWFSATAEPKNVLHGRCSIYLNEVNIPEAAGDLFVEIGKFCPAGVSESSKNFMSLSGYRVLILTGMGGADTKVEVAANFDLFNLAKTVAPPRSESTDNVPPSRPDPCEWATRQLESEREFTRETPLYLMNPVSAMFRLGQALGRSAQGPVFPPITDSPPTSENRKERYEIQSADKVVALYSFKVFKPSHVKNAFYAVLLLYYDSRKRKITPFTERFPAGQLITEDRALEIEEHLVDAVMYGKICEEDTPKSLTQLFHKTPLPSKNFVILPHKNNEILDHPDQFRSISRCDDTGSVFRTSGFKYSPPTMSELNQCDERSPFIFPDFSHIMYPFGFRGGTGLLPQSRRIVVNLKLSFDELKTSHEFLKLSSLQKTAIVSNLNYHTVVQIMKQYHDDRLPEKSPKRERLCRLRRKLEKMGKEVVDEIIKSYYSQNRVPLLDEIYNDFLKSAREEELRELEAAGPQGEGTEVVPPLFHCSRESFRQMLHQLGYVYGKLNTRSVVLMDERIVKLRGRYLQRIRENDALGVRQLPVVFLDETWIDPYRRKSFGFRPRHTTSMAHASEFTFRTHKVSRGVRLIVLAAGGLDGMVHGSTDIYAVKKADNDYHSNIHGERFSMWFSKLLDNLDRRGRGKHLIVMDNAPYHSVSAFPSKSKSKGVILEFLRKMRDEGKLGDLTFRDNMRKWELVEVLDALKERLPDKRIDIIARERGHEVVRLPPYNCDLNPIEMVWSFLKRSIRKTNLEQDITTVKNRAEIVLKTFTNEMWAPYVAKVKRLEEEYWRNDGNFDRFLEQHDEVKVVEPSDIDGTEEAAEHVYDSEFELQTEEWDGECGDDVSGEEVPGCA